LHCIALLSHSLFFSNTFNLQKSSHFVNKNLLPCSGRAGRQTCVQIKIYRLPTPKKEEEEPRRLYYWPVVIPSLSLCFLSIFLHQPTKRINQPNTYTINHQVLWNYETTYLYIYNIIHIRQSHTSIYKVLAIFFFPISRKKLFFLLTLEENERKTTKRLLLRIFKNRTENDDEGSFNSPYFL
jgi:hypothetical protein